MYPSQYPRLSTPGVRAMLLLALETGDNGWLNDVVMRTTSDAASETYDWLGAPPALHEFIGNRELSQLREYGFSISNKDYEANVWFWSKDMRRDKLGMIQTRIDQLAERVNDHPTKLVSTLIANGAASICYDGQYFFDTDHSEGSSGTQSNSVSFVAATGTTPTVQEMQDAIVAAIVQMFGFKDDQGEPLNQSANTFVVMVPVAFMGIALQAVAQLIGANGATATLAALRGKFTMSVVPNPRLSWTDKMVTMRTDGGIRPFVLQEEPGGRDVIALGEGSEFEQMNKKQIFGVDWAGNVGYGYWQGAVLTTFT